LVGEESEDRSEKKGSDPFGNMPGEDCKKISRAERAAA